MAKLPARSSIAAGAGHQDRRYADGRVAGGERKRGSWGVSDYEKLFAATIFLAMSVASNSLAQAPHFSKNEPYAKARVFLLKHGWKPVHAPNPGFECAKEDLRCEGRVATVDCAGTGTANCIFRWKRKAVVIDVHTVGEQNPTVAEVSCKSGCR